MKKNNKNILFYFFNKIYFLFSSFCFQKSNNQTDVTKMPNFYILIKNYTGNAGSMVPINYNYENYIFKIGDKLLKDNTLYYQDGKKIIKFFIKQNNFDDTISLQELENNIILLDCFSGSSADLMIYAFLLAKFLNINLTNIFIAGTGQIDCETGNIYSCSSLFYKLEVAIAHGIKIFIFAEEQKKDVENYCQSYIKNGFKHVIEKCFFYYVSHVDQIKDALLDISLNKKNFYENNLNLKRNIMYCNYFAYQGQVDKNNNIVQDYINTKKQYGICLNQNIFAKYFIEELQNKKDNCVYLIQFLNLILTNMKIIETIGEHQLYFEKLDYIINQNFFDDDFYKKYVTDYNNLFVFDDMMILDLP